MNWRPFLYFCILAFVVTLSVIIDWRLSDQALAVIDGVVAGGVASIPATFFVVWLALHARSAIGPAVCSANAQGATAAAATPSAQPQVIFVHATRAAPPLPALSPCPAQPQCFSRPCRPRAHRAQQLAL